MLLWPDRLLIEEPRLAAGLRVLFIAPYVPSRIRVRPFHLLRGLARRGYAITLLCPSSNADDERDLEALRPYCTAIVTAPQSRAEQVASSSRSIWRGQPLQAGYSCTSRLLALVQQTVAQGRFDLVHVEHLRGAGLALEASGLGLPIIFDAVDCISLLFERALRSSPSLATRAIALFDLARTRRYEATYGERFDHILVTSPEDRWALETLRHQHGIRPRNDITVVPNGVDLDYFAPQQSKRHQATIVFSGKMSYHANHAAACFLIEQIMPLVWHVRPDVHVEIVGANPAPTLREYATDSRIDVTGYVADLRPYLAQATVAVCPLRYGVGIQNKVLEALAMGSPVLTARQATVALKARPGRDLLIAEQPTEYADQLLNLLEDAPRRQSLGHYGRQYVERFHAWERSVAQLEGMYEHALQTRP